MRCNQLIGDGGVQLKILGPSACCGVAEYKKICEVIKHWLWSLVCRHQNASKAEAAAAQSEQLKFCGAIIALTAAA